MLIIYVYILKVMKFSLPFWLPDNLASTSSIFEDKISYSLWKNTFLFKFYIKYYRLVQPKTWITYK